MKGIPGMVGNSYSPPRFTLIDFMVSALTAERKAGFSNALIISVAVTRGSYSLIPQLLRKLSSPIQLAEFLRQMQSDLQYEGV